MPLELWYQIEIEAMCVRGVAGSRVMDGEQKYLVLVATAKKLRELADVVEALAPKVRAESLHDWRIGLKVTPKLRVDSLFGQVFKCVDVAASGYLGINDADGVIAVELPDGSLLWGAADRWVTA